MAGGGLKSAENVKGRAEWSRAAQSGKRKRKKNSFRARTRKSTPPLPSLEYSPREIVVACSSCFQQKTFFCNRFVNRLFFYFQARKTCLECRETAKKAARRRPHQSQPRWRKLQWRVLLRWRQNIQLVSTTRASARKQARHNDGVPHSVPAFLLVSASSVCDMGAVGAEQGGGTRNPVTV